MRNISATVDIAAPPERVWAILADLAAYPEWNPFIRSASGELAEGARLTLRLVPAGGRAMTFRPTDSESLFRPHRNNLLTDLQALYFARADSG